MAKYEEGDYFRDFVGPLGQPSELIHEDIDELKKKEHIIYCRRSWYCTSLSSSKMACFKRC